MKLRNIVVLAFLGMFAVAPAYAVGSHQLGVEGGVSVPSGNFGDAAKTGFNIGAQYQFMLTKLGVGAEIRYHAWNASEDMNTAAETLFGTGSEFSFRTWQYNVFGIVQIPMTTPMVHPYVKAGGGWYAPNLKLSSPAGDESDSQNEFGIVAGVGVDFDTNGPMKFGLGADYHRIKNSETDFMSVAARVMWPLKLGVAP